MPEVFIKFELPAILADKYLNATEAQYADMAFISLGEMHYSIKVDTEAKAAILDMIVSQCKIQKAVDEQTAERLKTQTHDNV